MCFNLAKEYPFAATDPNDLKQMEIVYDNRDALILTNMEVENPPI